jgi:hypothetical protein
MTEIEIQPPEVNQLSITEGEQTVTVQSVVNTLTTVITQGPQGPIGPPGPGSLVVDTSAKVDKSIVYYDAAASTFKADSILTSSTLTDGGNF